MNNIFKNLFNKFTKKPDKYLTVVNIIFPLYSNKFRLHNKDVELIDKKEDCSNFILEQQDEILILISEDFKKHNGNPDFQVNDVKQGNTYKITGLGFLENINKTFKVILVTNNYVFLKENRGLNKYCYTHEEIQRIKQYDSLHML